MNLRQNKRHAAARLTGRVKPSARRLFASCRISSGWVRVTRLDGGIRWVLQYAVVAR